MRTLDLPAHDLQSAQDLMDAGALLAVQLRAGDVLALCGDLGAGKTTLVRGLCAALGVDPAEVASPTFALVHQYQGREHTVVHADLYRLESRQEAEAAGLGELLDDPEVICAVEWPECAPGLLPPHTLWLRVDVTPGGRRVTQQKAR